MTGNKFFDESKTLKWSESLGIGFLPLEDTKPYDEDYIEKYKKYESTTIGEKINEARKDLFTSYAVGFCNVDVGIGSGQFMRTINCYGYDINPKAVYELVENGKYYDPFNNKIECATFWDSLEHIENIQELLVNITCYAFVSIPIFMGLKHVMSSKHYRPDEHCWYFTRIGFERFMNAHGFEIIYYDDFETQLGRSDIGTFVCKRVS